MGTHIYTPEPIIETFQASPPLLIQRTLKKPDFAEQLAFYQSCNELLHKIYRNEPIDCDQRKIREAENFCDCFEHFMEANGLEDYFTAANFAKKQKFSTVVDIGCACGNQAPLFTQNGIRYIGINSLEDHFCRDEHTIYLAERFPFPVNRRLLLDDFDKDPPLAISRLCLGYELTDYQAVAKQFDELLLGGPVEARNILADLYEEVILINDPENPEREIAWYWFHKSLL